MQRLFFLLQARTGTQAFVPSPVNERLFKLAMGAYKQYTEHSLQKSHDEIGRIYLMAKGERAVPGQSCQLPVKTRSRTQLRRTEVM